jgi:hypothetical protein
LSRLEATVSPIIAKAIAENTLPDPKSKGWHALLSFVLFQHARTPAKADETNEGIEKLLKRLAKSVRKE